MAAHDFVGYIGVLLLGYTVVLLGIHMFIPHPNSTKKVIALSYLSLIFSAFAQTCIVLTYFMPHLTGYCICGHLWTAAIISYVISIYILKFIYIERVRILNTHPKLGMIYIVTTYFILHTLSIAKLITCNVTKKK